MKKLLLGTAAIAALIIGSNPSLSADKKAPQVVGGTCCADLEERVSELEATVARKGNTKIKLYISGQVNAAMLWHNVDALDSKYRILDNDISESHVRFNGSAQINNEWSAGFVMTLGVGDATNDGSEIDVRESFLYLKIKNFGVVSLGQQATATGGSNPTEDINQISLSSGASNASELGSLAPFDDFIRLNTGLSIDNPFIGSKKQSIKFATNAFAGFVASASWSDDDSWDAALRFAGEFGSIRVAAGVGYRDETQVVGASRKFYGGSASIQEITSGLFVDASYGKSEGEQTGNFTVLGLTFPFIIADTTIEMIGGRVGIDARLSEVGKTTVFGEYQILRIDGIDDDAILYGVGLNQEIDAAAMDIYVSYRHIDTGSVLGETADVVVVGSKIRF